MRTLALLALAFVPAAPVMGSEFFYVTPPTPECGTVFQIQVGETLEFDIQVTDTDPNAVIGFLVQEQPVGSTVNPSGPQAVFGNGVDAPVITVHFSWTPGPGDLGTTQFLHFDAANFPGAKRLPCGYEIRVVPPPPGGNTFTQGGWGAKPAGNNPGQLLRANFATVYPAGVEIGIPGAGGFSLKFTSSGAIEAFLPTGSTPGKLAADATNPTGNTAAGVLAGQVLALQLSVDFTAAGVLGSNAIGGFTLCNTGNVALDGQTLSQVLAAANVALGGGALPYGLSYSGLNTLITNLNEGFDNGNTSAWAAAHICN